MQVRSSRLRLLAIASLALAAAAEASPIPGQVDSFSSSLGGWGGGASPTLISTGGPAGAGDGYLQLTATGGTGPGSTLATNNFGATWTGDFQGTGVGEVSVDLLSPISNTVSPMEMRVVLFGPGGGRFTSIVPFELRHDGAWHHAVFPIGPSDLNNTVSGNTETYGAMITNVQEMMFRYAVTSTQSGGTALVGTLGMDNVSALPEPASLAVALLVTLLLLARHRRRRAQVGMLAIAGIAAAWLMTPNTHAALVTTITPGNYTVRLQVVGTAPSTDNGVDSLTFAQGDSSRLYVNGRSGEIELIKNGTLQSTPYLNLTAPANSGGAGLTVLNTGGNDERGLLGLAFSPNFNNPVAPGYGKFYTYTSEPISGAATFSHPEITAGTATAAYQNVVREFTVTPGTDTANIVSSRVLFTINKVQSNHNGGNIRFGPDGYLYIGTGDGGGGNDNAGGITSATDGHTNNTGNGQDTTVAYGKLLRIDPNGNNSANGQYGIPADNPFASSSIGQVKEIYAYGLRNPWRFSFAPDGKLYLADVGQSTREEIDVVTKGANYGWPYNEGTLQNTTYASVRPTNFTDTPPVAEYTHLDSTNPPSGINGIAVIGGFIYHGTVIPGLDGKYVFGDYNTSTARDGLPRFMYFDPADGIIHDLLLDTSNGGFSPTAGMQLFGFGEDANGELYATMSNGQVLALTAPLPEPSGIAIFTLMAAITLRRPRR